jgi:proteasome lid subunit RPN8/RPN11
VTTFVRCPQHIIAATLEVIYAGGRRNCEALVLWLARRTPSGTEVVEAYEPPYRAAVDQFHIRPEDMRTIMARLRQERVHICAQVHSHPGPAFHSRADDTWAIVRHQNALSLVVPHFGAETSVANFLDQTAVFVLTADDRWALVAHQQLATRLEIVDAHRTPGE